MITTTQWPKKLPVLTDEQKRIREEFMAYWHEVLPKKYGLIERFNHGYPVWRLRKNKAQKLKTLEVGVGLGAHLEFEDLASQEYYALELRSQMADEVKRRFPQVQVIVADCQQKIPFPNETFDRVLAIHVLEHLPHLPKALQEIKRVLKADGLVNVVIPCEGGQLYRFCRRISAQRMFEKKYQQSYDWFVKSEHVNTGREVLQELKKEFKILHTFYFPFVIPSLEFNLCIGLTLQK